MTTRRMMWQGLALVGLGSIAKAQPVQAPLQRLLDQALEQTHHLVLYDPVYTKIPYPGGDVDPSRGVCCDVIIRAYRALGIDLKQRVHEDMVSHFNLYPHNWGLAHPDSNIDHLRVPNLEVFFTRFGQVRRLSQNPIDYVPGDIVTYRLNSTHPHIALVSDKKSFWDKSRYQIIHNIGLGPRLEDNLFAYPIAGHYRFAV